MKSGVHMMEDTLNTCGEQFIQKSEIIQTRAKKVPPLCTTCMSMKEILSAHV